MVYMRSGRVHEITNGINRVSESEIAGEGQSEGKATKNDTDSMWFSNELVVRPTTDASVRQHNRIMHRAPRDNEDGRRVQLFTKRTIMCI